MAPPNDPISNIAPPREAWRLKIRVIRLYTIPSFGNPQCHNSIEMIVMDEYGDKIHVTVPKQIVSKHKELLKEGGVYKICYLKVVPNTGSYRTTRHEYKLVFQYRTIVTPLQSEIIPVNGLSVVGFDELFAMSEDSDFLVDVVGLLTAVGEEKEYQRDGKSKKMIVIDLSSKSIKLQCALFDEYVNAVNEFLEGGYLEQPVVVLQLVKVKVFRGKVGLQNVLHAAKIMFNPDIAEVIDFRRGIMDEGVLGSAPLHVLCASRAISLEDEFMRLTPRSTIESLGLADGDGMFIVLATIRSVVEEGCWWYPACVCGRKLETRTGAYYCDFCHTHVVNVTPRYRIQVEVEDPSGLTIFVLFDRESCYLLKRSCIEVFTQFQGDELAISGAQYPDLFGTIVGKKLLFKVQTKVPSNSIYYETFSVRRVCDDPVIIGMFGLQGSELTPTKAVFAPPFPPISCGGTDLVGTSGVAADKTCEDFVSQVLKSTISPKEATFGGRGTVEPAKRNLEPDFLEVVRPTSQNDLKRVKVDAADADSSDEEINLADD